MSLPIITERLTRLDELIVDLTKPPVTVQLRNQVWLVIQDLEAIAADVHRISETVPAMKKNLEHYSKLTDELLKLERQYRGLHGDSGHEPSA